MYMRNLTAMMYFLLSLFGCDGGGTTLITHSRADGVDQIVSETRVTDGITRFECIRSASGTCHFALFPRDCASAGTSDNKSSGCKAHPVERFAIAAGDSREVTGLPQFDQCVSPDAGFPAPDCARPDGKSVPGKPGTYSNTP